MRTGQIVVIIAVVVFALDALSKAWALSHLHEGVLDPFIPGILQLTLTTNTGGDFGIGRDFKGLMTLLPIAICAGIIYWIIRREKSGPPLHMIEIVGLSLVLGGASGNIFDRLVRGRVTDFLDFAFMSFPVFNVADALIDVGVALIVLHSFFGSAFQPKPTNAGEQNG
jgi:signal peptidase II